ncbi:MAG: hypothetical protein O7C56_04740, partial [Rickettsia endosymbiont of Ixodes persulcatus]|nr:hypothetical protein [Rickettsia endosymbiont of Ixodes persulcatus]
RSELLSLLSTLLAFPLPSLKPSPSPSSPSTLSVLSTTDLGAITQVYSHQTRLYHILRVVLSSSSLPTLLTSTSSVTLDKSLKSLAGRAKWVDEADVKGSNIGGAVGKVWEVRQSGKNGLGKLSGKPRGGGGGGGGGEAAKKVGGAKRAKGVAVGEKRTKEDDDFLAGSDEEIEVERSVRKKKKKVEKKEEESPPAPVVAPRKKPRIVISDDEDDD